MRGRGRHRASWPHDRETSLPQRSSSSPKAPAETFAVPLAVAEEYERSFVPAFFAQWAPLVCDAAGLGVGDHVLDVACGTGVVARTAAERVGPAGRVTGVDLNPAMLEVARRVQAGPRLPTGRRRPLLRSRRAALRCRPLPDGVDVLPGSGAGDRGDGPRRPGRTGRWFCWFPRTCVISRGSRRSSRWSLGTPVRRRSGWSAAYFACGDPGEARVRRSRPPDSRWKGSARIATGSTRAPVGRGDGADGGGEHAPDRADRRGHVRADPRRCGPGAGPLHRAGRQRRRTIRGSLLATARPGLTGIGIVDRPGEPTPQPRSVGWPAPGWTVAPPSPRPGRGRPRADQGRRPWPREPCRWGRRRGCGRHRSGRSRGSSPPAVAGSAWPTTRHKAGAVQRSGPDQQHPLVELGGTRAPGRRPRRSAPRPGRRARGTDRGSGHRSRSRVTRRSPSRSTTTAPPPVRPCGTRRTRTRRTGGSCRKLRFHARPDDSQRVVDPTVVGRSEHAGGDHQAVLARRSPSAEVAHGPSTGSAISPSGSPKQRMVGLGTDRRGPRLSPARRRVVGDQVEVGGRIRARRPAERGRSA